MSRVHRVAVAPPEAFQLPAPVNTDQDDAGAVYTLATQFSVNANVRLVAIDWTAPVTLTGIAGGYQVAVYDNGGTLLTSQSITPQSGVRQRIYLAAPQNLVAGNTYYVAVFTQRYAFTLSASVPLPISTARMTIPAQPGFFNTPGPLARPASGPTLNFYFITPVVT